MRVAERSAQTLDGRAYTVLKFACRSPQCGCYRRVMAEKRVEAKDAAVR